MSSFQTANAESSRATPNELLERTAKVHDFCTRKNARPSSQSLNTMLGVMNHIHSFPPISDQHSRVLILGSMPGKLSLRESQYYAHPRNLFWRFMEEIFSISREASYQDRCIMLKDQRVALWDTLKTCTRTSSLDSDIADSSIVPNDISSFLRKHPQIELICFNGAKSEKVFSKNVAPTLAASALRVELVRLPSTSPANASIPIDVKLDQWQVIAR